MFTISQDSAIDFMAVSDKLNQVDNIPWEKWLILPFCFMLIEQDMGQRCFASENDNALKYSGILSGFIMFACSLIAIYFGIKLIGVNVDIQSSILLESVKLNTNPLISTFFMAALLMAVISTADSLLCSISSNVFCDFFLADTDIRIAKIITFIIGILSFIAATYFNNVVNLLMLSYEISVYTLFVPTIFAILGYKSNKLVSGLTMVVGAVAYLFFTKNNVYLYEIWTIAISAIIFFVTSKLFRKSEL